MHYKMLHSTSQKIQEKAIINEKISSNFLLEIKKLRQNKETRHTMRKPEAKTKKNYRNFNIFSLGFFVFLHRNVFYINWQNLVGVMKDSCE